MLSVCLHARTRTPALGFVAEVPQGGKSGWDPGTSPAIYIEIFTCEGLDTVSSSDTLADPERVVNGHLQ